MEVTNLKKKESGLYLIKLIKFIEVTNIWNKQLK